jgi:3-deoxy-D-manno-octulosonic-acid transferase
MYFLYSIGLLIFFLVSLPLFLYQRVRHGKYRQSMSERWGKYREEKRSLLSGLSPLWLHAVSVGEAQAAGPLLKILKTEKPDLRVVVSTVTETGQHMAQKVMTAADGFVYFPLDWAFIVRRVLKQINPRMVVMVETELWPNFLRLLGSKGIKAAVVNGRISPRSFGRYKWVRYFMKKVLANIHLFCMQSQGDAQRIMALGAPAERVRVTGNLKFDLAPPTSGNIDGRNLLNLSSSDLLLVAGSTHRGEESLVLAAYQELRREFPRLYLLLAPRHPERWGEVEELLQNSPVQYQRRTALATQTRTAPVILLDTIGELAPLYAAADLVFVGGSFVPIGGHNVLEPALYSKPVLFGPHMHNFKEIAQKLVAAGGAWQLSHPQEFLIKARELTAKADLRQKIGAAAYGVIQENQGAAQRTAQVLLELWNEKEGKP